MKCTNCGNEGDPICQECGMQGTLEEADPIEGLTKTQRKAIGRWDEQDLDEFTHQIFSEEAAKANNGGVEAQVRAALNLGYTFDQIKAGRG